MRARGTSVLLGLIVVGVVQAASTQNKPGLLVRLYDVGEELRWLPAIAPGELPNVVKVVPVADLRSDRNDFDALQSNFVAELVGFLEIQQEGVYAFRLISDDGARLWIGGRLIVDHDGTHGPTPKDGRAYLATGSHALLIRHFNAHGEAQVRLGWQPPGASPNRFEHLPAEALSHDPTLTQATAPGRKKIIPPLRRGRPGDGRPLETSHPGFAADEQAGFVPSDKQWSVAGGYLSFRAGEGQPAPDPVVWVPGDEFLDGAPVYSPFKDAFRDQKLIVPGGESKRVSLETIGEISQGCVFRFGRGPDVPFGATEALPLEMLTVRAMRNGLEIEFTRPLDPRVGWDPESYYLEQWPLDAPGGKAPQRDGVVYPVKSASVSADRRKVFLEIPDLKPSHVVYLRLLPPCVSEDGELPWSTEAWYTLNVIPPDRTGQVRPPPAKEPQNVLTDEERQAGWRLLFDGQTTAGWRGFGKDTFPDQGWQVIDGCLVRVGSGGDIATDEEFGDFELQLEWRISPAGNSGIFFRSSGEFRYAWETGPEMQVLDNAEHPDGQDPKTSAGSNYALHAPPRDVTRPVGFFNHVRILAEGPHVEYWLNGEKVVEYELEGPEWEKLVAESKFKSMPKYGRMRSGHIVLQDHGDRVWYRNVKIRTLPQGE